VSLILDALRKLERERSAPQRGVVVVAAEGSPDGRRAALAGALAAAVVLVPLTFWVTTRLAPAPEPSPATAPPLAAAAPGSLEAAPSPPIAASAAPTRAAPPASPPASPPATSGPPSAPASAAPAWVLQAIAQRDGRPVALINDRLVREGDSLNGARVVRIGSSEVELEVAGRRLVLSF
jgi:hypothetical protein